MTILYCVTIENKRVDFLKTLYLEWNYENLNESSLMFEQNSFISIPVNPISFIALSISETGTGTGQSN